MHGNLSASRNADTDMRSDQKARQHLHTVRVIVKIVSRSPKRARSTEDLDQPLSGEQPRHADQTKRRPSARKTTRMNRETRGEEVR